MRRNRYSHSIEYGGKGAVVREKHYPRTAWTYAGLKVEMNGRDMPAEAVGPGEGVMAENTVVHL